MGEITKTERQKHDPTRVSVFIDGEYSFSVSDEIAVLNKISVGTVIDEKTLNEVVRCDEEKRAYTYAIGYLARGAKTEKKMREQLKKKDFSEQASEKTIEKLKNSGYIDDKAFAENYVEYHPPLGKQALRYKLYGKGVDCSAIESALNDISEEDQLAAARALLEKKKSKFDKYEQREKKAKMYAFLVRQGFSYDIISSVVSEND